MGAKRPTTQDILKRADETLAIAKLGAQDVRGRDMKRRLPGLLNVAVFGRAVTNMLQGLRSNEPSFDDWYAPKEAEMRSDPLLKFFYELRTSVLKKGGPTPVSSIARIRHLSLPSDMARFGPPPPGAKGFFIGDRVGGSGWIVALPNGLEEHYYFDLPDEIGTTQMVLSPGPESHLGRPIRSNAAAVLCDLYVEYLSRLVADARSTFGR